MQAKLFQSLTRDEKIDFFLKCQELLTKFHPESEFIIRENNYKERLAGAKEMIGKYQGFCYFNDNICVLFNKLYMGDPKDPISALRAHTFKPPSETYNAASMDFVVFRDLKDCAVFCQEHYDPRIRHVIYVKNGRPKAYKTEDFISHIFNIPISLAH